MTRYVDISVPLIDPAPTHEVLRRAGVAIIETLICDQSSRERAWCCGRD
jgi:hypothetical protein